MNNKIRACFNFFKKRNIFFKYIALIEPTSPLREKNDIDKFSSLATDMLMFHDIRPFETNEHCGVYQAIQDSNSVLDEEISVADEMGIGIKYIK